tara:strand:- start:63 stop:452 length:390 start_codon:yes stop_codon:yes gene_type:complete
MKECYIFVENGKILAVYTSFQKFRKNTFHYILDFLVHNKKFDTKLNAGKGLKDNFSKFYGKNKQTLEVDNNKWDYKKFYINELENVYKIVEKIEEYSSEFTKINPKKGSTSFKVLNSNLSYVKLSPVYV